MKTKTNRGRVLGIISSIVISALVSGIVGFFTAIRTVESDIADVRERLATSETRYGEIVKPKLAVVDAHTDALREVERDIDFLKKQTELATQTNSLLRAILDHTRLETIRELRKLLGSE